MHGKYMAELGTEATSLFEHCTLFHFISFLPFSAISVTGRQPRKWDFCSDCSRSPLGERPVHSSRVRHGRVSGLLFHPLDFWDVFLYPPHSVTPLWVQLAENTKCLNVK